MTRPDGHSAATCVAVYDEPDHRAEIANDFVYAYRVRIAPGAHTLWHRHTEDTVYFALAAARAQEELPAREASGTEIPGNVAGSRPHKASRWRRRAFASGAPVAQARAGNRRGLGWRSR
jgi:hypothetical protein